MELGVVVKGYFKVTHREVLSIYLPQTPVG